jgi:hypothetical protein
MLEIQNQPQVQVKPAVSFKGNSHNSPSFTSLSDAFDRSSIDAERDEKLEQIDEQRQQFDDLANELEKSDSKIAKKASKGIRIASTILGLVGTFVVAKYSSKVAIETLKTMSNNPAVQKTLESLKGAKEPAKKVLDSAKKTVSEILKKPAIKENIDKIANSKIGKTVAETLKNEKVAKVLEPIKKSLKSVKDIKVNGSSVQSFIENTMAATTTGSVLVDNLTGRNNNKSNVELATGA